MKRYLLILSIVSGTAFSLQANCEDEEDWSQLGSDNYHSFLSTTSVANNLEILQQYQLGLEREAHFCELFSPAVVKKRIYISGLNHLHCLDLLTGELLYEAPAFSMYPFTPTIVDNKIYLATERNLFSCLDASTGETLWERDLSNLYEVSPLYDADSIYITIDQFYSFTPYDLLVYKQRVPQWATLLALDKKTGEEIWRYSMDDSSNPVIKCIGFPILVDGSILFGMSYQSKDAYGFTFEGKTSLVCLDARTGTFQWECENIFPFSPLDMVSLPFSFTY